MREGTDGPVAEKISKIFHFVKNGQSVAFGGHNIDLFFKNVWEKGEEMGICKSFESVLW